MIASIRLRFRASFNPELAINSKPETSIPRNKIIHNSVNSINRR